MTPAKLIVGVALILALGWMMSGPHQAVSADTARGVFVVNTLTGSVKFCRPMQSDPNPDLEIKCIK